VEHLRFALCLLVALVPSLVLHEYAHALAADRPGDPSPRRWGRLTLNPRRLVDPFGSAWLVVNVFMFVFRLMPVPGLDGAKILAPCLPPRPRQVFMNLDQYLVLFMLVIFFLLAGPLLSVVKALASGVCTVVAGDAAIC
jgi:Zn-dependent protease